ncbi:hypothetical protein ACFXTO_032813 [Malus domestica]
MVMSDLGTIYLFGTYSKELKTTFGYDQETLNLLGFFKNLGANIGIFAGLIAEVTTTWFELLNGAATNFFGYFTMWLGVTGKIAKPEIWHMCLHVHCNKFSELCEQKPPRGEDYTILQAILSIDMLLIFIATLFGLGSSFTATDNLGQIDEALGYKPQTINTIVSLISIWNFLCSLNERDEGSEGRVGDQNEVGLPVQSYQTKAPLPYDPHATGGITAGGATPDNSCGLSGECEEARGLKQRIMNLEVKVRLNQRPWISYA